MTAHDDALRSLLDEAARCEDSGDPVGAERAMRETIALDGKSAQAHSFLGTLLLNQGRLQEAERPLRRALDLSPQSPTTWTNYGALLARRKQEAAAENCYRTAISLDPDYVNASFNLAYLLLRQGRFEEGWRRFEYRDWYPRLDRALGIPRWAGQDLHGKSILIGIEAGYGDMIQFCRYARHLKAAGAARVSMLCHPPLARLLQTLPDVDEVMAVSTSNTDGVSTDWDYWVPPMSLPFWLNTRHDTIPRDLPYLSAEPEKCERFARLIGDTAGRLRIGLVWQGNPRFENDRQRSLPSLAALAPLATVGDVQFFSLQKGHGEGGIVDAPFDIRDLAPCLDDFSDTAAALQNLDLLISVDTAVAHLAGALGKPCWVLLPEQLTDWRWMADRMDSPWYPEVMRLFRQDASGTWPPVIEAVKSALQRRLAQASSRCQ